jgi:uncharacterized delta-60 repeat protein
LLVLGAAPAHAAQGDLDPTFDSDGRVVTDFFESFDQASAVVVQPDGKILAVGTSDGDFALARYNTDGSLDSTFGSGDGIVTTDFGNSDNLTSDNANAVALEGSKIVVAGSSVPNSCDCQSDFALARYNADGSLDPTFGSGGLLLTDFSGGSADSASGVAVTGGKIVAAGSTGDGRSSDFALARYNDDGSLDPTFSGDGLQTTDITGASNDFGNALVVQRDGKLVVAGSSARTVDSEGTLGDPDFALARYDLNGALDPTFSGDGRQTTDFAGFSDTAYALALQASWWRRAGRLPSSPSPAVTSRSRATRAAAPSTRRSGTRESRPPTWAGTTPPTGSSSSRTGTSSPRAPTGTTSRSPAT